MALGGAGGSRSCSYSVGNKEVLAGGQRYLCVFHTLEKDSKGIQREGALLGQLGVSHMYVFSTKERDSMHWERGGARPCGVFVICFKYKK